MSGLECQRCGAPLPSRYGRVECAYRGTERVAAPTAPAPTANVPPRNTRLLIIVVAASVIVPCAAVALASGVAWLALVAMLATGASSVAGLGLADIADVVQHTQFGHLWLLRLVILLGLLMGLILRPLTRR